MGNFGPDDLGAKEMPVIGKVSDAHGKGGTPKMGKETKPLISLGTPLLRVIAQEKALVFRFCPGMK